MKEILEGRWDCEACHAVNVGHDEMCHNCGSPKGDAKNYLIEGEKAVNDPERLAEATAGPNWVCAYCDHDNRNYASCCTHCGAGRDGGKVRETHVYEGDSVPHSAEAVEQTDVTPSYVSTSSSVSSFSPSVGGFDSHEPYRVEVEEEHSPQRLGGASFKRILIVVAFLIVAGVIFFLTRTHDAAARISGFNWDRTVHIEQYTTVREGDWSIPGGGRQVSSETRVHHTEPVFDHYETDHKTRRVPDGEERYECGSETTDLGNGYFSRETKYCTRTKYKDESYTEQRAVYRDEPVYKTWYNYDIDKWVSLRTVPTSGVSRTDPAPFWGTVTLVYGGQTVIGAERESGRDEHYSVTFVYDTDKYYTRQVSYADWAAYDMSGDYTLVINNLGSILNDPLRPDTHPNR